MSDDITQQKEASRQTIENLGLVISKMLDGTQSSKQNYDNLTNLINGQADRSTKIETKLSSIEKNQTDLIEEISHLSTQIKTISDYLECNEDDKLDLRKTFQEISNNNQTTLSDIKMSLTEMCEQERQNNEKQILNNNQMIKNLDDIKLQNQQQIEVARKSIEIQNSVAKRVLNLKENKAEFYKKEFAKSQQLVVDLVRSLSSSKV